MKLWILCLFVLASSLRAQDLEPELFPLAVKHEQDVKTLLEQKNAALERARTPYLKALESAEEFATTAGELPVVAAVNKERGALGGEMAREAPADLPKGLRGPRKAYLDAAERIEGTCTANRQRIDADYLRALAALQSKAGANAKLAAQLAAEKQRLLDGVTGSGSAKAPDLPKETLEKELIGHWYWGTEKLWVAITPDGKAYLDSLVLTWTVQRDGTVTFVNTQDSESKATCEFNIPDKTFQGTDFQGKPVKGWLKLKK